MNKLSIFFKGLLIILIILLGIILGQIIIKQQNVNQIYSIKTDAYYLEERDIDYQGMTLLEYNNILNDYAEIYYIFYDYTTDPSYFYTLQITDENNNSVLLNEEKEVKLACGYIGTARIEKNNLDKKINISIYEKLEETNEIVKSASKQIDLAKDLEKQEKIDQSSKIKDGKIGDVDFKYIDSEYVYFGTTAHAYSQELVGENFSVPIKSQYGNYLISEEHIELSCEVNVNNLTLEDAFQKLVLINETVGQYGLSNWYGMSIYDKENKLEDTIIISFEEMIDLCNGKTINKNGKQYTKDSFELYADVKMIKDKDVEIGNGIKAIKYHFERNEELENYMFTYKDKIYYIRVSTNERTQEIVQQFLDSLKQD